MNFDRHLKNFGIIRNVETLEWEKVTPIFDTGECMECDKTLDEINFYDRTGKFFSSVEMPFSKYLNYINVAKFDISKLDGLVEEYKSKLIEYRKYTDITDKRIDKLTTGLQYRIDSIKACK